MITIIILLLLLLLVLLFAHNYHTAAERDWCIYSYNNA